MLEERLDCTQRVQDQVDIQNAAEQLEVIISVVGGLVFEIVLQLTTQAIVAAL